MNVYHAFVISGNVDHCIVTFFRYELLLKCWHENPTERPEFGTVCEQLRQILEQEKKTPSNGDNYYEQPVESPYYMNAMV